jgi:hypothetical protein
VSTRISLDALRIAATKEDWHVLGPLTRARRGSDELPEVKRAALEMRPVLIDPREGALK